METRNKFKGGIRSIILPHYGPITSSIIFGQYLDPLVKKKKKKNA